MLTFNSLTIHLPESKCRAYRQVLPFLGSIIHLHSTKTFKTAQLVLSSVLGAGGSRDEASHRPMRAELRYNVPSPPLDLE
ncbi:rCG57100 [Rattus norvegicus]|uniref:RCG57100 n=1 Tax=Rattus norvegicus TaxID=10116 RepID=A6JDH5_RAT|nr:rCG57100 [Rattus norvegicus]